MSQFIANYLKKVQAYQPGEQPKPGEYIKLNTNENPFPPPPEVSKIVENYANHLHLYSDTSCKKLTKAFSDRYEISTDSVLFGNGSDEILAFCFLAYGPDCGVRFPTISYGFYQVFADLFQVKQEKMPLNLDFTINPSDYLGAMKTVLLANPNAPTGLALSLVQIREILEGNPENIVIIDEAYVDFGGESAVILTKTYKNLIVTGTFSKSRNLAGARLGYAVAHPSLIQDLNKVKYSFNPYNVNTLTQAAGVASLENEAYFQDCRDEIIRNRSYLAENLQKIGFSPLDSQANFLFTTHENLSGPFLYQALKERKILVRHFDENPIENYLRITIGTREQMDVLLLKLEEIVEESHA